MKTQRFKTKCIDATDFSQKKTIEFLRKKVADQQSEILELKVKLNEGSKLYLNCLQKKYSQIEAIEFLFEIMASGHTHRQKRDFADMSKTTTSPQYPQWRVFAPGV